MISTAKRRWWAFDLKQYAPRTLPLFARYYVAPGLRATQAEEDFLHEVLLPHHMVCPKNGIADHPTLRRIQMEHEQEIANS